MVFTLLCFAGTEELISRHKDLLDTGQLMQDETGKQPVGLPGGLSGEVWLREGN